MTKQKRYQYWGFKDGKSQKLWTKWFNIKDTEEEESLQSKNPKLKNEYRTI